MSGVNFWTTYYRETNEARRRELDTCLANNLACRNIDSVYLLHEPPHEKFDAGRAVVVPVPERPTYADYIAYAAGVSDDDTISILANSDIYLSEEAVEQMVERLTGDTVLALSRWDVDLFGVPKLFQRCDSQDVWAWRGKLDGVPGKFCQGKRGCDNRFCYELFQAGYQVLNPSKTIKTFHLHMSGIRRYTLYDHDLVRGPYRTVEPTE